MKRILVLAQLAVAVAVSGCSVFAGPTPVPTLTPRPTFTPGAPTTPSATPSPAIVPTKPAPPTATVPLTAPTALPTATRLPPTATPRPAAPPPPAPPTATTVPTNTPVPVPTATTVPSVACNGDEEMTFAPNPGVVGAQVAIAVTSALGSPDVALQLSFGGAAVDVQGPTVQTGVGKGYIWRWTVTPGQAGRYDANFYVGATILCTANWVQVNAAPVATNTPTRTSTPTSIPSSTPLATSTPTRTPTPTLTPVRTPTSTLALE